MLSRFLRSRLHLVRRWFSPAIIFSREEHEYVLHAIRVVNELPESWREEWPGPLVLDRWSWGSVAKTLQDQALDLNKWRPPTIEVVVLWEAANRILDVLDGKDDGADPSWREVDGRSGRT